MKTLVSTFLVSVCLCMDIVLGKSPTYSEIKQKADEGAAFITQVRRYLHQHPERCFQEYETSAHIQSVLTDFNISFTSGWGVNTQDPESKGTGIVAEIGTGLPPCISLRADIDALPIEEAVDLPFKSTHPNMMHACGHDAHASMLLGAGIILKEYEDQIEGTVRLIFQPAEEGGGGGHYMVQEGALTKFPPVQYAFGAHVSPAPTGTIGARSGSTNAATDDFHIIIYGKGGHAAGHHKAIDPLPAAMAIIRSIYDMYARELYFQDETAGVYTVSYVDSGEGATNVIPHTTIIGGTMRALHTSTLHKMRERLYQTVEEVSHAYRCNSTVSRTMNMEYPATINDAGLYEWFQELSPNFGGVTTIPPIMAGEDFSFTAQEVPSLFWSIGVGSGSEIEGHPPTDAPAHNPQFALDERAMPIGSSIHAFIAMQAIDKLNQQSQSFQKCEA